MAQPRLAERIIEKGILLRIYRDMLTIRAFEERVWGMYQSGQIPHPGPLYIRQEGVAAGAIAAANDDDYIACTHRCHGHTIVRTGDLKSLMAEVTGKDAGFCGGRGGSMHAVDFDRSMLGGFATTGASITLAAGAGFAARVLGNGRVALGFFDERAANQGSFHEGVSLAALWNLPVVFVCENNQYALPTSQERPARAKGLAGHADAYGIPGVAVDGSNALAVYRAVKKAADRARAGQGPSLIEARTYRSDGRCTADPGTSYRSREEEEAWKQKDPIPRFLFYLLNVGALTDAEAKAMENEERQRVEVAVYFAQAASYPDDSETAAKVYAPEYRPEVGDPSGELREMTVLEALREAIAEEMERDHRLVFMGDAMAHRDGRFDAGKGLAERFGPGRVLDSPIPENGLVGAAVGAALAGVPAIAEMRGLDFASAAMDPIVNVAAKAHWLSGGKQTVPVVIRTHQGADAHLGPTHGQTLETWFTHVPGLKVALPSNPYDYKGLLKTAIRDPNPVVFIEHRMLYSTRAPVPAGEYAIPFGVAAVKRPGLDVTVVALAAMVPKALAAAEVLAAEGIEIEIIDPRTLAPLDVGTIVESVKRTGRLIVFQEAYVACSFGSEIARVLGKAAFDHLEAPILVVGATAISPSAPILGSPLSSEDDLIQAVRDVLGSEA